MSRFGTLLLLLTQLRATAYGWSTNIYLQANQSSAAVKFYTAKGFEKAEANVTTLLPLNWRGRVNLDNIPNFYLKFVDDDTNLQEGERWARNNKEKLKKMNFYIYTISLVPSKLCIIQAGMMDKKDGLEGHITS